MVIEHLKKEFPNLVIKDLQGGCNVYLPGDLVLTFWFKKRKWKSNKRKEWRRFADTQDAIGVINGLGEIQMRKAVVVAENAPNNTTQLCIDHINKKIELLNKNKPNAVALTILKALTFELEQYL